MLVILLNCVTLGMYQPCVDDQCISRRCRILQVMGFFYFFNNHRFHYNWRSETLMHGNNDCLQVFDDFIFAFFSLEMIVKMIAMGAYGPCTYLADSWNRLDFFIVIAGYETILQYVNKLLPFYCFISYRNYNKSCAPVINGLA